MKQKKPNGKGQAYNSIFEPGLYYEDEAKLLDATADHDKIYIEEVLKRNMDDHLRKIKEFEF